MNQELIQYVQRQIRTSEDRLRRYTHDEKGVVRPSRFMYKKLEKYIRDFSLERSQSRVIIIPGLRGVGKTTLMAQAFMKYAHRRKKYAIFISIDEVVNLFNVGISEIVQAYEEVLGGDLESVSEKTYIFLDEVQTDSKWAQSLKILHDKTSNVFFCCTGSSAVVLQTTPDLSRGRAIFEPMTPLCFGEYAMLAHSKYPVKRLKEKLRSAIYFSESASDVYENLLQLQGEVHTYWTQLSHKEIDIFLKYGSLPFTHHLPDASRIYDAISLMVDGIIKKDLPLLGGFDMKTLSQVKRLLFVLAENDTTSLNSLERVLGMDRLTIASVLDALERAELLIKVPAYGSNMTVAKKPAKYLFMSSAIRMSFFAISGQESTFLTRKGKLLEDTVGAHLYREFVVRGGGAFRYDSAQGGADFIVQLADKKQILIEVGMGNKDRKQVQKSMKKIPGDYGIIFSQTPLSIDDEQKIVSIPLDYYFLM